VDNDVLMAASCSECKEMAAGDDGNRKASGDGSTRVNQTPAPCSVTAAAAGRSINSTWSAGMSVYTSASGALTPVVRNH